MNEPLHTITTKDRFGLVLVKEAMYQIWDIFMRMLTPRELFRAQGFPDSYKIDLNFKGRRLSSANQVKMVGNSVSPPCAAELVRANAFARAFKGPSLDEWSPGEVKPVQLSLFDFDEILGAAV